MTTRHTTTYIRLRAELRGLLREAKKIDVEALDAPTRAEFERLLRHTASQLKEMAQQLRDTPSVH
jgi:hypothetical protein